MLCLLWLNFKICLTSLLASFFVSSPAPSSLFAFLCPKLCSVFAEIRSVRLVWCLFLRPQVILQKCYRFIWRKFCWKIYFIYLPKIWYIGVMTQEKQSSFLFFFFSSEVLNDLEQTNGFHDIYRREKKKI